MQSGQIDLGLAPPARLGRLTLTPALRLIRRDDGVEEVVEPRVMQVLLALAEARGQIVRREDLTLRCWEGRVVGEDAINRVLSRLRRVAEGTGQGSFRIETITRIGYRLIEEGAHTDGPAESAAQPSERAALPFPRRAVLAGMGAGGLALAGAGWWRYGRSDMPAPAREAMERGIEALRLMTPDHLAVAVAAFRQAAQLAPKAAAPWGCLALAWRWLDGLSHGQEASLDAQRARDAAQTALRLDPDNGDAQATLATLVPKYRNWLAYERACQPVLMRHPGEVGIGILTIDLLSNVGRIRDLSGLARGLLASNPAWPWLHTAVALSSWCLGRLDEADGAIERAFQQWPRHTTVWFQRQMMLAYSGRGAAALAMIEDEDHRPVGLPDWDFDLAAAETRALMSRSRADIDKASSLFRERAGQAVGIATGAVRFFAAVGRLDEAFKVLEALYFDRGFDVKDQAYTKEQGTYIQRWDRPTWLFWLPPMAALRVDPRLIPIFQTTGLSDYWQKSAKHPDFAIAGGVG
ncbi:winged helix-turn-helix domain-containing protein [Novosphingobium terrae]|uniref:winged helix-turn-helix domain-containing protein n=1 Tax=Novosphingobium terrae TaxID=2726189 RepID=UPI001981EA2B|nr:winged helix-turn-helix domain-containing protein [Novosphingobium terrae]